MLHLCNSLHYVFSSLRKFNLEGDNYEYKHAASSNTFGIGVFSRIGA